MRRLVVVLAAGCWCAASACGGSQPGAPRDAPGTTPGSDAATDGGASPDAGWTWQPLVSESWSMDAVDWGRQCAQVPITQEMWIDGFRPAAGMGAGNDHQILLVTNQAIADQNCTVRPLYAEDQLIYASGIGSNEELRLPAGTAVHLAPGTGETLYLTLYSHIVNVSNAAITGTSGVDVHVADAATVVHDVDMILGGLGSFTIPATDVPDAIEGDCSPAATTGYQWHLVALWPHMHESGRHATVSVTNGGAKTTVLDTDYSYLAEQYYPGNDTLLDTGGQLEVGCTLQNAAAMPLMYDEEDPELVYKTVCWAGIYKYPTGTDAASGAVGPRACVIGL